MRKFLYRASLYYLGLLVLLLVIEFVLPLFYSSDSGPDSILLQISGQVMQYTSPLLFLLPIALIFLIMGEGKSAADLTAPNQVTSSASKKWRVATIISGLILIAPFVLVGGLCFAAGNPGGCGDAIILFGPVAIIAAPIFAVSVIGLLIKELRSRRR
jgi:hypothetical protein